MKIALEKHENYIEGKEALKAQPTNQTRANHSILKSLFKQTFLPQRYVIPGRTHSGGLRPPEEGVRAPDSSGQPPRSRADTQITAMFPLAVPKAQVHPNHVPYVSSQLICK